jgi:cytochrome P450
VVQSARWFLGTGGFLESCAKRYGDTFTVHLAGFPPFVVTSDPEAVREIFTGDPDQLHAGRANAILKPILGEHSLLLIDGPKHKSQRKLMMPPFHGERMQAYGATMRRIADEAIDRWPIGRAFPIHKEMQRITLDVILRTVFGLSPGAGEDRLRALLTKLLDFGDRPGMLLFIDGRGRCASAGCTSASGATRRGCARAGCSIRSTRCSTPSSRGGARRARAAKTCSRSCWRRATSRARR